MTDERLLVASSGRRPTVTSVSDEIERLIADATGMPPQRALALNDPVRQLLVTAAERQRLAWLRLQAVWRCSDGPPVAQLNRETAAEDDFDAATNALQQLLDDVR